MKKIFLSLAHMCGEEQRFVQEAFDTNWVVPLGPNVDGFERDLEEWLGRYYRQELHVVALSAGTAAIHLSLVMLGVGPGDEVICQSFTFAASANPICYQGATPVFVDSEPGTWNMDPQLLREAIEDRIRKTGRKPKAIVMVHLYGNPARVRELMLIADLYGIPVVEDSAEAMGSVYDGQSCGTFWRLAASCRSTETR
jgi:dTDP-4-amino-4,6-dideoxygalactose transaminase